MHAASKSLKNLHAAHKPVACSSSDLLFAVDISGLSGHFRTLWTFQDSLLTCCQHPTLNRLLLLQGLSVTELEAQMLARGAYSPQPPQQFQVHQQAPPQPAPRPPQGVYNPGNSGLYSPSAAAALARLTQSAKQGHQPQSNLATSPNVQRLSPMLQSSVLANQLQQRQARTGPPPGYASRTGQRSLRFYCTHKDVHADCV